MKKNILVVLLLSFCSFNGVSADQVSCEKIESYDWRLGNFITCYMDKTTQINLADTTITSRDGSVQGLWFQNNKKIFFLPVSLSEKFPNLRGLAAYSCSLTTISRTNLDGLSKLRGLYLNSNQIEKIRSDVFDDLVALEVLWLDNNKLKFINGKTFARLTKLTHVDLSSNQCINKNFDVASKIAVLQQTVNENCSFDEESDEFVKKTFSIVSSLADKKCDNSQDLTTFATNVVGIEKKTSEVINKLNELKTQQMDECGNIAKALEAQARTHAKALKDQLTYFNEVLEHKVAEIVDVKVKSEMQTMLKMTEIQRLEEDVQRKNAEIFEKNEKIKKLEEKNEILMNCGNCP